MREAAISIDEMEINNIINGTAYIKITGNGGNHCFSLACLPLTTSHLCLSLSLCPPLSPPLGEMSVNAPIEVTGNTQDAYFTLLIPDPQDRSQLAEIGTVFFPAMHVPGTVFDPFSIPLF